LPWSLILPGLFFYLWRHGELVKSGPGSKEWRSYLALWGLMPAVFFTFAGNILWTYLLPGFPALALWASHWLNRQSGVSESAKVTLLVGGTVATLALTLAAVTVLLVGGQGDVNSAKSLVALYQQQKVGDEPLLYVGERRFSVDFYSRGKAEYIDELSELETRVSVASFFVAIESDKLVAGWSSEASNLLTPVATRGAYTLLHASSSGVGR
jgi:4-amino-4-deoxy-L-arabinose transferase-like glycosyltransferase